MNDVEPIDDSESVDALDESTLLPIGESAGVSEDDPDQDGDGDHEPFVVQDKEDTFELMPDEVPGRDEMPG